MGRWLAAICVLLAACGGSPAATSTTAPPAPPRPAEVPADAAAVRATVGIALTVEPNDAHVEINDLSYGKAFELDPVIALAPGIHALVITRDGYRPYRAELTLTDRTETLDIRLEPLR